MPRPGKILCVGLNYRDHARETGQPSPEPVLFSKFANSVVGPGADAVVLPEAADKVDDEAELAVVIGRRASR